MSDQDRIALLEAQLADERAKNQRLTAELAEAREDFRYLAAGARIAERERGVTPTQAASWLYRPQKDGAGDEPAPRPKQDERR